MTLYCNTYTGLHSWGYNVVKYTIPIITAERMIALFASTRYEAWTFPKVVIFINSLTWVYGGIVFIVKRSGTVKSVPEVYCSSFSRSYFHASVMDFVGASFLVPFTCLCIDTFMHFYCKYLVK
uniref:G_PROTEIN_RECEP_F1_2 domain-containing protein n=1 Tax=Panagrellus redivivus TaxID=6233 RepID=A0A7E4UWK6_PANRE